jgi:PST family polysaccharide transporter
MTPSSSLSSSLLRIISQNIGPLVIAQIVSFAVNFLQLIYLARILAPEHFGIISLALSIQFFAMMFTNLGTSFMGTRELVVRRRYDPLLFWNITALRLVLIMPCIGAAVAWLALSGSDPVLSGITLIFLFTVIPVIITPDWVFTGLEKMRLNSLVKILVSVSCFCLILILVHGPDDLLSVPLTYLIATLLGLVVSLYRLKTITGSWGFQVRPSLWITYIRDSVRLGISSYLVVAIASVDLISIGVLLTTTEVGYYSAASRLILAIHTMLGLIVTGVFPAVTRTMEKRPDLIRGLSPHIIMLILAVEVPGCLLVSINADLIIGLLYGGRYVQTIPVLVVLIWSVIPVTLCHLYTTLLNATFRESVMMRILTLHLILLLPVMIGGTYLIGIPGTAMAILSIGMMITALYAWVFKEEVTFPGRKVIALSVLTIIGVILPASVSIWLDLDPILLRIIPVPVIITGIITLRLLPIEIIIRSLQIR